MSAVSNAFFCFLEFLVTLVLFCEHTTTLTPASGLVRFVDFRIDDHGSFVIFRSASVRPRHLFDHDFDHDYFFKLPLQGVGCPITDAVFYCTPCLVPGFPTYEPNSNEGEYSHPFRRIQYKRIPSRRPMATLAMLLCRRIARCRYRRRQCGLKRAAAWGGLHQQVAQ